MHTVTFYSFKGGVGRTMALVNVAAELAQKGRRVLVVDFDLEAPGLDTFRLPQTQTTSGGIVDFVHRYRESGTAPDVADYLSEAWRPSNGNGQLWIMPSGAHVAGYSTTLANIDWGALYDRHDGYLLFEDLREQWRATINPDYVLIDSRTGHTDTGGICTRQLPDSVVVFFFPNEQNLRGLTKVVSDIKAERRGPRRKVVQLHYVMSNVPDIDDEDSIIEDITESFKNRLDLTKDPMIIHRYDSLSLLNQVVFTVDRPRSRLSTEYRVLASELMKQNPEDRIGALDYIRSVASDFLPVGYGPWHHSQDTDDHLKQIEKNHDSDGEVLFRLASCYGDDDAEVLYTRAVEANYRVPAVYLARAFLRFRNNRKDDAETDALHVLKSKSASNRELRRAASLMSSGELMKIMASLDGQELTPSLRYWIASTRLVHSRKELHVARNVLQRLVADRDLPVEERMRAERELILVSIGVGAPDEALSIIRGQQPAVDMMNKRQAFNYGMASWAATGDVDRTVFEHVVDLHKLEQNEYMDANYLQCMAISHWVTAQQEEAEQFARQAIRDNRASGRAEFSCWRYMKVSTGAFGEDTDKILKMINGAKLVPAFIGRHPSTSL